MVKSYKESTHLADAMMCPVDGRTLNGMSSQIANLEQSEVTFELGQDLRAHQECLTLGAIFHKGNWEKATAEQIANVVTTISKGLPVEQWKPEIVDKLLVHQVKVLRDTGRFRELMDKITAIGKTELNLQDVQLNALNKTEEQRTQFFSRTLWRNGILVMVVDDTVDDETMHNQLRAVIDYLMGVDMIDVSDELRSTIRESLIMAEFLEMLQVDTVGIERKECLVPRFEVFSYLASAFC